MILNIPKFDVVDAKYEDYPGSRFCGIPLVEALSLSKITGGYSKSALHKALSHYPEAPTAATRRLPDFVRQAELGYLNDVVYQRAAYKQAIASMVTTVLEAYANRPSILLPAVANDQSLATLNASAIFSDRLLTRTDKYLVRAGNSAGGYAIIGCTGSGKSTLLKAFTKLLGKVIVHRAYKGHDLGMIQVPIIQVSIPHDATIRAFILQFAAVVDFQLGESIYQRQVRSLKTIGDAALLMLRICSAINLGALVIDDLQNLRSARGPGVEIALNLLSLLTDFGISIISSATPAVGDVIKNNVRNARKLVSSGLVELRPMLPAEARAFQDKVWVYQYTSRVNPLTPEIREAWNEAGAGIPAFKILNYRLAQTRAIGTGKETITANLLRHVADIDMAILRPAIDALHSGDPEQLIRFDDLILREELNRLFKIAGMPSEAPDSNEEEFTDVPPDGAGAPRRPTNRISKVRQVALPMEDPLALMLVQ